jgi:hypothetical protein
MAAWYSTAWLEENTPAAQLIIKDNIVDTKTGAVAMTMC